MVGGVPEKLSVSRWIRVACAILILLLDAPGTLVELPAAPHRVASQDESPADPISDDAEEPGDQAPGESEDLTRPASSLLGRSERPRGRPECSAVLPGPGGALARSLPAIPARTIRLSVCLCRLTC